MVRTPVVALALLCAIPSVSAQIDSRFEAKPAGAESDDAWPPHLKRPDTAPRWNEQLKALLEYYGSDPGGRSIIGGWFKRANRFTPMIRRKLREAHLPEDLLYVAMIESGFDPRARSPVGALGLWQFLAATADEYGLKRSQWVDQRMNPDRSTDAAVRYLDELYEKLGSWDLTLAAYNMGYGALLRSMRKYNTNDFGVLSSIEAGLPFETIQYVAKATACATIGRNAAYFGHSNIVVERPVPTATVNVPGGLTLETLSGIAGVSARELRSLNPELLRDRIPPDACRWTLRIPVEKRDAFAKYWKRFRPPGPAHRKHALRFGETLAEIAKRYGTSVVSLRKLNNLDETDTVAAGVELRVPDVDPVPSEEPETVVVAVPSRKFDYPDRRRIFFRAVGGMSTTDVAAFFGVTRAEIREWNDISDVALLPTGIILQLFVSRDFDLERATVRTPDAVRILVRGSDEFFEYHEALRDRVRVRYRVRPGDTLDGLGKRFELSVGSIARINRFDRYTDLRVGQEIVVYVPKRLTDPALFDGDAANQTPEPAR
jgi:membrane-bound lytic murein transglycosylase D